MVKGGAAADHMNMFPLCSCVQSRTLMHYQSHCSRPKDLNDTQVSISLGAGDEFSSKKHVADLSWARFHHVLCQEGIMGDMRWQHLTALAPIRMMSTLQEVLHD